MILYLFIGFAAVFAVCLILLNIWLSHGTIKPGGFITAMLYGLGVGVPTIAASYYRWYRPSSINLTVLLLAALIFVLPVLLKSWYNVIKGRESCYHNLLLTAGMAFTFVSFLLSPLLAIFCVITGWIFFILFFGYLNRYPYLNSAWLQAAFEQALEEVKGRGKYSSKPVVIKSEIGRRFVSGFNGLSLIIKKDRLIGRISRKLHIKYGEPNLEELFRRLLEKIIVISKK